MVKTQKIVQVSSNDQLETSGEPLFSTQRDSLVTTPNGNRSNKIVQKDDGRVVPGFNSPKKIEKAAKDPKAMVRKMLKK